MYMIITLVFGTKLLKSVRLKNVLSIREKRSEPLQTERSTDLYGFRYSLRSQNRIVFIIFIAGTRMPVHCHSKPTELSSRNIGLRTVCTSNKTRNRSENDASYLSNHYCYQRVLYAELYGRRLNVWGRTTGFGRGCRFS